MTDEVEFIPDSDLFKPQAGRHKHDFPGIFPDYCKIRGLNPIAAAMDNEVDYSLKMKRAIKARMALRSILEQ